MCCCGLWIVLACTNRVFATGVSNGGGMSARLACDAADLVAAAAPVAGGYGALPDCRPTRAVGRPNGWLAHELASFRKGRDSSSGLLSARHLDYPTG